MGVKTHFIAFSEVQFIDKGSKFIELVVQALLGTGQFQHVCRMTQKNILGLCIYYDSQALSPQRIHQMVVEIAKELSDSYRQKYCT